MIFMESKTKIVDFSNLILGRACSRVAKTLLLGERVVVINAEKAVVRGTKTGVLKKFVRRQGWTAKGNPAMHSTKISRLPDRLVRWSIKHMLPIEKSKGQTAFERLVVYVGTPKTVQTKAAEKWVEIENREKKNIWTMQKISAELGMNQK